MPCLSVSSDTELAMLAQGGNREAEDVLLRRFDRVCGAIAKTFAGEGLEFDDVYAIAREAACDAVRTFDEQGGAKVGTYLRRVVNRRVIDELRKARSLCRYVTQDRLVSLDLVLDPGGSEGDQVTLGDAIAAPGDMERDVLNSIAIEQVVKEVFGVQSAILLGLSEGKSYGEIADEQGVRYEHLSAFVQVFRRIARRRGLGF